jgi:hypothetical protein
MPVSFPDQIALLNHFLDRRAQIVDAIERQLLNVQSKATSRRRDRESFEHLLRACFIDDPTLPRNLSSLYGQLTAAHRENGFEPVLREQQSHRLDPLALVIRGYQHWDHTRWPGRNGRIAFAQTVFATSLFGDLEHLSLRIWDSGALIDEAGQRLCDVQRLLDRLNADTSTSAFTRDARWLIQTAQGPLTRELRPYFTIAERIAGSFDDIYRLGVHRAGAVLAGGHLRSQQRYRAAESGRPLDDPEVLAITRNSNSMDAALLAADLVALLDAYGSACDAGDADRRRDLADAILQGLSADPELFVTRVELLFPATVIEDVFIETGAGGRPRCTPAGERHLALVHRYRGLLDRLAPALIDDLGDLDPAARAYSPLGIAYGFCADILSNIATSTLTSPASANVVLEDLFESRTRLDDKLSCARAWERLPTRGAEQAHFTHSIEWAREVFDGVIDRLRQRTSGAIQPAGRLFLVREEQTLDSLKGIVPAGAVPAQEHYVTSDIQRALANGGTAFPKSHLLSDRREGRYLASVEQGGAWFAVSKVVLTTCLSRGNDAVITDLPGALVERLRLTCPDLIAASSCSSG